MAEPVPLPFANGFYESNSLPISAQQCVNAFRHVPDEPALNQETLLGTPGISLVNTSGPSVVDFNRGSKVFNKAAYFVNGPALFRMNVDGSLDNLGTILGSGRVTMATNDDQLMILVPAGEGYIFTDGPDTLTIISDLDFRANGDPMYVVFLDGFFVCTTNANKFIVSAVNNGLDYNALDFGSAESSPDAVVTPFVYKNQLFIGGESSLEGFNNIGGSDFPFQRTGLFLDEGIKSPFSTIDTENSVMFVGGAENEGPAIWALEGNGTGKVSTKAIDSILQRLSSLELAEVFSWSYGQSGHYFVGFVLPDTTLVFDSSSGKWHERMSRVPQPNGIFENRTYRVASVVAANGVLYVGDSQDGRIGVLDEDVYTEYSEEIVRIFSTQPFQNNMKPFSIPYLELTVESGVGNVAAPDPKIRLQQSRDGGKTYGDERTRKIGKKGRYNQRCIWRRNGRSARFDVFRFIMSDPVKFVAIQLTAQIEGV
jgi:hypothetical protein